MRSGGNGFNVFIFFKLFSVSIKYIKTFIYMASIQYSHVLIMSTVNIKIDVLLGDIAIFNLMSKQFC